VFSGRGLRGEMTVRHLCRVFRRRDEWVVWTAEGL